MFGVDDRLMNEVAYARLRERRDAARQARLARMVRETCGESEATVIRLILTRYAARYP